MRNRANYIMITLLIVFSSCSNSEIKSSTETQNKSASAPIPIWRMVKKFNPNNVTDSSKENKYIELQGSHFLYFENDTILLNDSIFRKERYNVPYYGLYNNNCDFIQFTNDTLVFLRGCSDGPIEYYVGGSTPQLARDFRLQKHAPQRVGVSCHGTNTAL